jgi:gliding motility-associated-like protein
MVIGTSYTVEASDGTCTSAPSTSFSNGAQFPVPTAGISGSLSYCTGGNTTLTASGGTGYAWTDAASNNIGNTASVTVTQGTYTVIVSNSNNCTASATATVIQSTSLSLSITGNLGYCPGGNTTITASGGTNYVWSDAASSTTPSITVTQGTYSVTASDASGCTGTASATVTTLNPPAINISGALSYCQGGSTTLTATGGTGYVWNDASNSTTPGITVTQGNYTVTGTDANGCTSTSNVIVTENAPPTVTISGLLTYCTGGNTTLTATGGTGYLWSTGATTAAVTVTQGAYDVTATDATGCTGTASATIVESSSLSVAINGVLTSCPGSSTILTATGGTGYTWSNGSTSNIVTVSQGTYSVTGTDATCSGTASAIVTEITTTPVDLGSNLTICEDSSATIDAGIGYLAYAWNTGDTTQTISTQSAGTYTVTVDDANGCSVSASISVATKTCTVVEDFNVLIPTAFSPNGDGNNDVFRCILKNVTSIQLDVYNRWGELVFETTDLRGAWDGTFKGRKCDMGVYIYYVNAKGINGEQRQFSGNVTLVR